VKAERRDFWPGYRDEDRFDDDKPMPPSALTTQERGVVMKRLYALWLRKHPGVKWPDFVRGPWREAEAFDDLEPLYGELLEEAPAQLPPPAAETPEALPPTVAPKPPAQRRARPRSDDAKPTKSKIGWPYAPVPRAILRDGRLGLADRAVLAGIADALNLGWWNTDRHVDVTYAELAERLGVSRSPIIRAIERAAELEVIEAEALKGTAGMRLRFRPEKFIPIGSDPESDAATTDVDDSDGDDPEQVA